MSVNVPPMSAPRRREPVVVVKPCSPESTSGLFRRIGAGRNPDHRIVVWDVGSPASCQAAGCSVSKRDMNWLLRFLLRSIVISAVILLTAWAGLAIWFRLPAPDLAKLACAFVLALLGVLAIREAAGGAGYRGIALFALAMGGVLLWWASIAPPSSAKWAPDVGRQVTGSTQGDMLTLTNVRDFEWRSDQDFDQRWETRTYDLKRLRSADVFMSHWSGPAMAHMIVSFGFDDGRFLAWSVEVRRREGGEFSPIADFFKSNALVIVAADERDVVRVRSNVRGEDVQLYRLTIGPDAARALLFEYVADANALAQAPAFYNSITTNCTTTVVKLARAAGGEVPFDWRLIANGYLPEFLYERGVLDTKIPFRELEQKSHIRARALDAGARSDFSRLIRAGAASASLGD